VDLLRDESAPADPERLTLYYSKLKFMLGKEGMGFCSLLLGECFHSLRRLRARLRVDSSAMVSKSVQSAQHLCLRKSIIGVSLGVRPSGSEGALS
jgi:hypothetical protein